MSQQEICLKAAHDEIFIHADCNANLIFIISINGIFHLRDTEGIQHTNTKWFFTISMVGFFVLCPAYYSKIWKSNMQCKNGPNAVKGLKRKMHYSCRVHRSVHETVVPKAPKHILSLVTGPKSKARSNL